MTVPASAGPTTPGEVTVTNHTQHTVIMTVNARGSGTAFAVSDGHRISTGVTDASAGLTKVEPNASVSFPAYLLGEPCQPPGQPTAPRQQTWLPAGDYTFVPEILANPGGDLAGRPVTVHWTGGL